MFDEKMSENFRALMLIAKSMLVGCAGAADQPNFRVNRSSFKLLHDNARNRREFSTCLAGISQFTTYRNEAVKIVKIHTHFLTKFCILCPHPWSHLMMVRGRRRMVGTETIRVCSSIWLYGGNYIDCKFVNDDVEQANCEQATEALRVG